MKFLIKLFLLFITILGAKAQEIPDPVPNKIVNDFASFFSATEQNDLERMLVNYNDSTSTQIAVVTVPTLHSYEINDYGTRLYNKWGIGGKKGNNGVLILIKTKSQEERNNEVAIITGYGMEGFLPDALAKRIIENEMIPRFREGKNYEGVKAAATTIFKLASGAFTADQYMNATKGSAKKSNNFLIILGVIILFFIISSRGGGNRRNLSSRRGGGFPLWLLLSLLNSGGGRGSFGGFSSGGGVFGGGGGGGFGGFGGGRSGGGGASGSW